MPGCTILNLGTGTGYSVFELLRTFEGVNGCKVPFVIGDRRSGDVAAYHANPDKARRVLGWTARRNLADMCRDAWAWQQFSIMAETNADSDCAAVIAAE